jgi:hypothetical protein
MRQKELRERWGGSYLDPQECFERGADRSLYIGTSVKQLLFGCKRRLDWLPVGLTNYLLDLLAEKRLIAPFSSRQSHPPFQSALDAGWPVFSRLEETR